MNLFHRYETNEAIRLIGRVFVMFITIGMASGAFAGDEGRDQGALATILERQGSMQMKRSTPDTATIQRYRESLREDGSWPDVDYQSKARNIWPPHKHLSRIEAMALAYAQTEHNVRGDKELLGNIHLALDHWLAKDYTSTNWWWNQIATPRALGQIAVLINDELTGDRRRAMLAAIGKCSIGMTGANLMDKAQIVMVRACLANDDALLKRAVDAIVGEINVSNGEGIQPDWSFHQHGACSQPLSYGRVYLHVLCDVGWLLRGTPYEIPPEKRAIVSNFYIEGIQWMTRGIYTAPSTIDRQVSRPNALRGSGDFRGQLRKWIEVDPERAPALKAFLARQNDELAPLSGFRHYYRSDLTTYHRPGFALFLKTRSNRVKGTESINGENLKGKPFLHTGDHYIIRDGSAYTDLPPAWDWSRLPGLTMFEGIGDIAPQSFVGGLGDDRSGLAVMDYKRSLRVRKLWAFHGDLVMCLLGGWQDAEGKQGLRTTLDQCARNGPVRVNVGGKTVTLERGDHHLADVRWVLHNGIGYMPLKPSSVALSMVEATGSWHQINAAQSDAAVKADVFTCDLMHGVSPAAEGFILVPGSTLESLEKFTRNPPCEMIRNDSNLQCIRFDDGTFMAAFYEPGKVKVDEKPLIEVDKPCLALWSGTDLYLCDPTNPAKAVSMQATWQGKAIAVELPAAGKPLRIPNADITVNGTK